MSGFCGWSVATRRDIIDPDTIKAMSATMSRFDAAPVRSARASGAALAVAGDTVDVIRHGSRLACVWGPAHFTDVELARLAAERGSAHALAEGYHRRGVDVLNALSGSFAV